MGVGVKLRVNGFEDEDDWADAAEAVESVESLLSVLDWRDLRRKGSEGRRYVGKTGKNAGGSEVLRRNDIVGGRGVQGGWTPATRSCKGLRSAS